MARHDAPGEEMLCNPIALILRFKAVGLIAMERRHEEKVDLPVVTSRAHGSEALASSTCVQTFRLRRYDQILSWC